MFHLFVCLFNLFFAFVCLFVTFYLHLFVALVSVWPSGPLDNNADADTSADANADADPDAYADADADAEADADADDIFRYRAVHPTMNHSARHSALFLIPLIGFKSSSSSSSSTSSSSVLKP